MEMTMSPRGRPVALGIGVGVVGGEGEDVRGLVLFAELAIEVAHRVVVDDGDGDFVDVVVDAQGDQDACGRIRRSRGG